MANVVTDPRVHPEVILPDPAGCAMAPRPSRSERQRLHQRPGAKSLNRFIFVGHGGAKSAERWDVGKRIRDVEEGPDGSLWMLEDANAGALIHVTPKLIGSR